ncbi:MAG: translation initiation factor IF-2 associated domain-containing protein, partial [Xanthomonadaceae bacterium]|nr:translation initiation factor IF-2 associated domain-containing protein [Xanthomonadaceae bacterium]
MSQQTTIRKLAELVNTPVEKLLEQLAEAGMKFSGPDQTVTSAEKLKLLGFLKRSHGKSETAAEDSAGPKKITLNRNRKQEITVGGGKNKTTVDVVVRKKVTLVKPADGAQSADGDDERTEILRKLEESRQRNLEEQQRLADEDRKRAEETAERKRKADEAAARTRAEAEAAAATTAKPAGDGGDAAARPKTVGHGHGHANKPPRPDAPRTDDRAGHKAKPSRGSHVMVADVEDDDTTARFAGQLHLSATERERRSSARGKPKAKRQLEQSRSGGGQHGFTRPTEKVVREVAIGEAITVSDLAQKLALKGG